MEKGVLGTQTVVQIGIIVRDIVETSKKFAAFLGTDVPEAIVTDAYDKALTEYQGKPSPARSKLAFFHTPGGLDIELIEPDANPSTWREFLENHGEGVHHLAFFIKDMKGNIAKLGEMGMDLVQKGEYAGGRYAYIDSNRDLKVMLELLEND